MVFSSHIFIFYFLPVTLVLYFISPKSWRNLVLTILSYVFYGWANPLFVVLMFVSTFIDYIAGLIQAHNGFKFRGEIDILSKGGKRTKTQKTAMIVSICSNLLLLGFFIYFNFSVENYNLLVAALGFNEMKLDSVMQVVLPLGISFYTFQSMSYSIDVYRGEAKAMRSFVDFACFVSMFPQLVAGPIIRFSEVADQLLYREYTAAKFSRGIMFFFLGLAKKIILANPCGKIADTCFNSAGVSCLDAWYGVISYSFQIYFDFSAYSDMAIGLGLMFGFIFPKNFNRPYISQSITEFWHRWHISLSSWLKDYLYIPLGGNKKGNIRTYINLFLVMLIGGLWHGASWNFVIWGGIHGIWLAFERMQGKTSVYVKAPACIRIAVTFLIVTFAWVFFRGDTLVASIDYIKSMFGFVDMGNDTKDLISGLIYKPYYVISFVLSAVIVWCARDTWEFTQVINWKKIAVGLILFVISLCLLIVQSYNPFIYFIF